LVTNAALARDFRIAPRRPLFVLQQRHHTLALVRIRSLQPVTVICVDRKQNGIAAQCLDEPSLVTGH
jgi:hypothetical protein